MNDKKRLTISLDTPDYDELQALAERDDRSLSWVISQAVKRYIEAAKTAPGGGLPREQQIRLTL